MEPCFNPALENQAIGRVHRLGQKRQVEIIRLIQEDSVESRLLKLLEKKYRNSVSESCDSTPDDDDSGSRVGNKIAAGLTNAGLVGNVKTDKVSMMTDEFDLLFGAQRMVNAVHFEDEDSYADGCV